MVVGRLYFCCDESRVSGHEGIASSFCLPLLCLASSTSSSAPMYIFDVNCESVVCLRDTLGNNGDDRICKIASSDPFATSCWGLD
jgi:hypothetical protein